MTGLTTRRLALDHDRLEPLRCAVDGGRQTGRPTADDHEIVVLEGRLPGYPEPLGELEHCRALEHGPVLEQCHRQAVVLDTRHLQQLAGLRLALDVEPPRRHPVASQEVTEVVRRPGEAMADQTHAAGLERGAGLPGAEQVLDDREQLLLGRVPRLE